MHTLKFLGLAACAAVLVADPGYAQGPEPRALPQGVTALGPVSFPQSQRYRFESKHVGRTYVVEITRIDSLLAPTRPGARLPVVFVTDNDVFSSLVPAIVRANVSMPAMIVVGIGYDVAAAANPLAAIVIAGAGRTRDFTPTFDEALHTTMLNQSKALNVPYPESDKPGGAAAFLAFIDDELKPFVAAQYPADVENTAIVGHSLGGLFVLHALFTSPESFDRYIAISPAADYAGEVLLAEHAERVDVAARVFVGVGGADLPPIRESAARLDAAIQARFQPSLRYTYRVLADETHNSVVAGAITSGLRAVFDPVAPLGFGAGAQRSAN